MTSLPFLLSFSVFVGCSQGRDVATNSRAAEQSSIESTSAKLPTDVHTVIYTHRPKTNLSLDIIKPTRSKSLHRALLLIHGGGWVSGTRSDMDEIARYLSDKGFLTASVDYRLAPRDTWPAQLEDVQAAVRYLRSHATDLDIDADKIGAAGVSAGGHLSLFLGAVEGAAPVEEKGVSSKVQAVCSISGIHDLNLPLTSIGERYRIVQSLIGEGTSMNKEARSKASPINFVDAHTAPTMFIQGNQDPLVPQEQSTEAEEKLKKLGVHTNMQLVDGMGHGLSPKVPLQANALNQLTFWMYKYLK